ncbi:hypothetical protein QM565_16180, partial [Geitlerinema splendidum]|nr:hypothetical protein [Geitlerinema splendidum]
MNMQTLGGSKDMRGRSAGQTLIIAILVLAVLLILSIAFASILNRNITETGRSARRTVASDLAQAGVKYAHSQLQNSTLGADWRPTATPPQDIDVNGFTKDPDALYLREASGHLVEPDPTNRPGYLIEDLGGPDYLGPYSRVGFTQGRALIRVRYAPSAYDSFGLPTGALREPGAARGYIVIDSVGRAGALDDQGRIDPTRLLNKAVQVVGLVDGNAVRNALGEIKAADASVTNTRKIMGFASIGLVETARYFTNKHDVSRPAEIGFPSTAAAGIWRRDVSVGVDYEGSSVRVPMTWGANPSGLATIPVSNARWDQLPGGGGLWSNAEVLVHGSNQMFLNRELQEAWFSTKGFKPANDASSLTVNMWELDNSGTNWVTQPISPLALPANQFDSNSPNYTTGNGAVRDGRAETDDAGFPRATKRKEAPSITATDPQTGGNRYRELTQRSGRVNASGTIIGEYGYGEGVYVNSGERGNRTTAEQRTELDPSKALPNDWLNPNNAASRGWQGQYYIPMASYVQLLPDGFVITRDSRSSNPTWIDPVTGSSTGQATCRFWVRGVGGPSGRTYIVNSILNPGFDPVNGNYAATGQLFNGVLLFEGDVRVRGVIPTDIQLTLASLGTIYVEGSIVKGVVTQGGATINRPSTSMLALLAKDYVTINTTQFFGPAVGQLPRPKTGDPLPNTANPIELDLAESPAITLQAQFLLNPIGNDPSFWGTFAEQYTQPLAVSGPIDSKLLISSSADDGGPAFIRAGISAGTFANASPGTDTYLFPEGITFGAPGFTLPTYLFNAAEQYFVAPYLPVYGLGDASLNAYPKFETVAMNVVNRSNPGFFNSYSLVSRKLQASGSNPEGVYSLGVQDPTFFVLDTQGAAVGTSAAKNFLISKTAIAPFDVRIEAVMYAENGSFFVIPGNWFNSNPDDTRAA